MNEKEEVSGPISTEEEREFRRRIVEELHMMNRLLEKIVNRLNDTSGLS
jgi:hypothetical protein